MADTGFFSIRFENMAETEEDTYSVFLAQSDEGPEMVWYDEMGDPIIEVGISQAEWDEQIPDSLYREFHYLRILP